jgi:hypothetical protein
MTPAPRFPHLSRFVDRHGKERVYCRPPGKKAVPMPLPVGCAAFRAAYAAAMAGAPPPTPAAKREAARISIRERAARIPQAGVYLLMREGEVVYVGSSKNVAGRVATHRSNGRPFDKAFFIATSEDERLDLEEHLIRVIRPEQNRDERRGGRFLPTPRPKARVLPTHQSDQEVAG